MIEVIFDVVEMLKAFPFFEGSHIGLTVIMALALAIVNLIAMIFWGDKGYENFIKEPPEVSDDVAGWTVRRDSWWVQWYHYFWDRWPRDICSYFWLSLVLGVLTVLDAGFLLMLFLCVISIFAWIIKGIAVFILLLPIAFRGFPAFLMMSLQGTGNVIVYVGTVPATYKFGAGILLVILARMFLKSNACKVTRLRMKAWKERRCLLIRVK